MKLIPVWAEIPYADSNEATSAYKYGCHKGVAAVRSMLEELAKDAFMGDDDMMAKTYRDLAKFLQKQEEQAADVWRKFNKEKGLR